MYAQSFHTTPIQFQSQEDLEKFVEFYSNFVVDPFNFKDADGVPLHELDMQEALDGNRVHGSHPEFDINEDDLTVILSGNGGLDFCRINNEYGYLTTSPVVGNFLDDVFDLAFWETNKGFEIYIEKQSPNQNIKEIETIKLDEHHSTERYQTLLNNTDTQIGETQQKILALQLELKKLQDLRKHYSDIVNIDDDSLPF